MNLNKIIELLENKNKEYLYHASFRQLLPSIKKNGLNPRIESKSWSMSGNYIYLSADKYVAESYAEIADNVPDSYLDNIIVFEIDKNLLNLDKLTMDTNNKAGDTYQYAGIIPWENRPKHQR